MPPIGERGGTLIGMSGNPPTFAKSTEGSRYPRRQMPPKFSSNLARDSGRIIKQASSRRRRLMRPSPPPPKFAGTNDKSGGALITKSGNRRMKKRSPARPPWAELPFEITANILHRLGAVEILETAQYVCKAWHSVCNDPSMWRVIDIRKRCSSSFSSESESESDSESGYDSESDSESDSSVDKISKNMCRYAVDLSQGMLVDIRIKYFASHKLLDYIAERSEKLRRLRLECCDKLSDDGLMRAIKRFPNLEEFGSFHYFDYRTRISSQTVETIGESCPLLRSFALNEKPALLCNAPMIKRCDKVAYAIARSMPELRHLQLQGNTLTDKGLEAILDGCPHLESLDLKECYHVELKGDLKKRCSSQIKCLRWKKYPRMW